MKRKQALGIAIVAAFSFGLGLRAFIKKDPSDRQELKRIWQCGFDSRKYTCSDPEIAASKKWFMKGTPEQLVAKLKQDNIRATQEEVERIKNRLAAKETKPFGRRTKKKIKDIKRQTGMLQQSLG